MRHTVLAAMSVLLSVAAGTGARAAEHGRYITHSLLHAIGTETYDLSAPGPEGAVLTIASTLSDRGTTRASTTTLTMGPGLAPRVLEFRREGAPAGEVWRTEVRGGSVAVQEAGARRSFAAPAVAYAGFAQMPAALQMTMMRYWAAHHEPAALPILRASDKAPPLEIRRVGADTVRLPGGPARLTRYTVANLMFGREVLWMDGRGRLAAAMTFAGGLPQEQVLEAYMPAFDALVASGVRQEMADLDALGRQVRPEAAGTFAIVGAR